MAVNLVVRVNIDDPSIAYGETGADYVDLDLSPNRDYLIWTGGSDDVKDGENEPTETELNIASTIIQATAVQVPHCLLYDYSAGLLREVEGMGDNERYVFCFSFDGETATEPTLEAWDDSNHATADKHVLGGETGYDSFVNAICTTSLSPGTDWVGSGSGTKIAGNVTLGLNDGDPITMTGIATGETYDCYANIGILIPASYDTPGAETFVTTVRFTWM